MMVLVSFPGSPPARRRRCLLSSCGGRAWERGYDGIPV